MTVNLQVWQSLLLFTSFATAGGGLHDLAPLPYIEPAVFPPFHVLDSDDGCQMALKLFARKNEGIFDFQTPSRVDEKDFTVSISADVCSRAERMAKVCHFRFKCGIIPIKAYLGVNSRFLAQYLTEIEHVMVCPEAWLGVRLLPLREPKTSMLLYVARDEAPRDHLTVLGRCMDAEELRRVAKEHLPQVQDEERRTHIRDMLDRLSAARDGSTSIDLGATCVDRVIDS